MRRNVAIGKKIDKNSKCAAMCPLEKSEKNLKCAATWTFGKKLIKNQNAQQCGHWEKIDKH